MYEWSLCACVCCACKPRVQLCRLQDVCFLAVWHNILWWIALPNDWLYLDPAINHKASALFKHPQTHIAGSPKHKQNCRNRALLTFTHLYTQLYTEGSSTEFPLQQKKSDGTWLLMVIHSLFLTLCKILWSKAQFVCMYGCRNVSLSLTNVFALHVIVEGDTVWHSAGALGALDWRHIKKWRQKTCFVPLSSRSWCFNVHVIPCNQPKNVIKNEMQF